MRAIESYNREARFTSQPRLRPTKDQSLGVSFWAMLLAGTVLSLLLSGCGTPGYVRVDAIEGTLNRVMDRHDVYVERDHDLSSAQQKRNLRDTELLRKLLAEAQEPTEGEESQ